MLWGIKRYTLGGDQDMSESSVPNIGDRIRFAISYNGLWRPLGWLRAGRDGSIYLGLLLGSPSVARYVVKKAKKATTIKYDEGKVVSGAAAPKSSRVSFKASGEIHLGDEVLHGIPM